VRKTAKETGEGLMLDQYLVAALALVAFALFAAGYFIGQTERRSRLYIYADEADIEHRFRHHQ
jgi:hypothetical protein